MLGERRDRDGRELLHVRAVLVGPGRIRLHQCSGHHQQGEGVVHALTTIAPIGVGVVEILRVIPANDRGARSRAHGSATVGAPEGVRGT